MKKLFLISFVLIGLFVLSSTVFAADELTTSGLCKGANMSSVSGIVNWASCFLLSVIVPFLFALATAAFILGVIKYFLNPSNEKEREKGKEYIVWGLVGLFLMVSMWGIVKIFTNTFEVKNVVPQLPE